MFPRLTFLSRAARRSWPALLLSMLLAGCGSSPVATHQYTLPQHPLVTPQAASVAPAKQGALIMPVQLAGQLQVNGIVFQTSPVEVNEARNNLWADTLSSQLDRSLYQALSNRTRTVSLMTGDSADVPSYYVTVQINQFQGRYDGKAIVSGLYRILDAERRIIRQHAFSYEEPLAQDGYAALVDALDRNVQQLADNIAQQLDALSRQ
ncbi:PqiC family protein [Zymobacter palmae]|uniref:Uncharacterized protein conserved in bacteria n=1 Tax=Zymobacter palmae TaxID=33074 RepID=A0A348HB05_9GAMM|nr:ABC-type transport auxiliary lipoprotein family protein [Zymobacter palmae]BBG28807.1 uncharacterized protein conserved in bacteria [Zymobacter palmae]